jgi:hypothetical protein
MFLHILFPLLEIEPKKIATDEILDPAKHFEGRSSTPAAAAAVVAAKLVVVLAASCRAIQGDCSAPPEIGYGGVGWC